MNACSRSANARLVGEIGDPQPLPLQDAEPLLHLVHPRAMHRRVMEHEPRVLRQPRLHLLALVHPQVVQDHMDRLDRRGDLAVQLLQERDELGLPLPLGGHPVDLAGPGVERREQVQRPAPPVLVLDPDRSVRLSAASVGDFRGRGCKLVFSSTQSTTSSAPSGRV